MDPLRRLLEQEKDDDYILVGSHNYVMASGAALLEDSSRSPRSTCEYDGITDALRRQIATWTFDIVDYFNLSRESASIALNYVDRYMVISHKANKDEANSTVSRSTYKLLTISSIYVAIKVHGIARDPNAYRFKPSAEIFVNLSQNQFSARDITMMELELCRTLKWRLNPPLPVVFLEAILDLLPDWQVGDISSNRGCLVVKAAVHELSCYYSEVSACISDFTFLFKPSSIACASILSAIDYLKRDDSVLSNHMPPKRVVSIFLDQVLTHTALRDQAAHEIAATKLVLQEMCPGRLIPRLKPYSPRHASSPPCEESTSKYYQACPKRRGSRPAGLIKHSVSKVHPPYSENQHLPQHLPSKPSSDPLRRQSAKRKYSAAFEWTTVDIMRRR